MRPVTPPSPTYKALEVTPVALNNSQVVSIAMLMTLQRLNGNSFDGFLIQRKPLKRPLG